MGLRFQRRIKILPGLNINLSKSGVGFSAGVRGLHMGIDGKGRRYASASIPKTGISWREYQKAKRPSAAPPPLAPPTSTFENQEPETIRSVGMAQRSRTSVVLAIALTMLVIIALAILAHLK